MGPNSDRERREPPKTQMLIWGINKHPGLNRFRDPPSPLRPRHSKTLWDVSTEPALRRQRGRLLGGRLRRRRDCLISRSFGTTLETGVASQSTFLSRICTEIFLLKQVQRVSKTLGMKVCVKTSSVSTTFCFDCFSFCKSVCHSLHGRTKQPCLFFNGDLIKHRSISFWSSGALWHLLSQRVRFFPNA